MCCIHCVLLSRTVLYILCYIVMFCVNVVIKLLKMCYTALVYGTVLYWTLLYCAARCCTYLLFGLILIVLCCTVLYCAVLTQTVVWYVVLFCRKRTWPLVPVNILVVSMRDDPVIRRILLPRLFRCSLRKSQRKFADLGEQVLFLCTYMYVLNRIKLQFNVFYVDNIIYGHIKSVYLCCYRNGNLFTLFVNKWKTRDFFFFFT